MKFHTIMCKIIYKVSIFFGREKFHPAGDWRVILVLAKITDKFLNLLGFEVVEESVDPDKLLPAVKNEEPKEELWKLPDKPQEKKKERRGELKAVQSFNPTTAKMVVFRPASFDEVHKAADQLCNAYSVIIDLNDLTVEDARRVLDYLSGVVFAIDGNASRVGSGIFIFTPKNITIEGAAAELMFDTKRFKVAEQETAEDEKDTKIFNIAGA